MQRLVCIGNITKDTIITPKGQIDLPGGSVYYISKAISQLKEKDMTAVCGCGRNEQEPLDQLKEAGIRTKAILSDSCVCFENRYLDEAQTWRVQRVTKKGGVFLKEDLEDIEGDYIHLGTLLREDFPLETIKYLSTKGKITADAQGFLRTVSGTEVFPHDWDDKKDALRYIHLLKASREEMTTITGETDPHEAALKLADWGVKEVVLTLDQEGSLVYTKGEFTDIPAYPCINLVDATGCGDTYMAGYLYKRCQGASIYDSGCFAAAMCTIKLQVHGPFSGTESAIDEIIRSTNFTSKIMF